MINNHLLEPKERNLWFVFVKKAVPKRSESYVFQYDRVRLLKLSPQQVKNGKIDNTLSVVM